MPQQSNLTQNNQLFRQTSFLYFELFFLEKFSALINHFPDFIFPSPKFSLL